MPIFTGERLSVQAAAGAGFDVAVVLEPDRSCQMQDGRVNEASNNNMVFFMVEPFPCDFDTLLK
jgi:hypothetical protein